MSSMLDPSAGGGGGSISNSSGNSIKTIDDVLDSASNWENLRKGGVKQGWIQGTDAQTVFNNIAAEQGISLNPDQTVFKDSSGNYVGIHEATVEKNGVTRGTTLDLNIGGQRYKIGFIP